MAAKKKIKRKSIIRIKSRGVDMITPNLMLCRGSGKMVVPDGSGHVRSIEFILPPCDADPEVSATIYPTNSSGTSFTLYEIKKNRYRDYTQIAVDAIWTLSGTREITEPISRDLSKLSIHCDLVAYAVPVLKPKKKTSKRKA